MSTLVTSWSFDLSSRLWVVGWYAWGCYSAWSGDHQGIWLRWMAQESHLKCQHKPLHSWSGQIYKYLLPRVLKLQPTLHYHCMLCHWLALLLLADFYPNSPCMPDQLHWAFITPYNVIKGLLYKLSLPVLIWNHRASFILTTTQWSFWRKNRRSAQISSYQSFLQSSNVILWRWALHLLL